MNKKSGLLLFAAAAAALLACVMLGVHDVTGAVTLAGLAVPALILDGREYE